MLNAGPVMQEQIRGWTSKDPVVSVVLRMVHEGWPTSEGSKRLSGIVTQSLDSSYEVTLLDGRKLSRHVDHIRLGNMVLPDVQSSVFTPLRQQGQGQQQQQQQPPPTESTITKAGATEEGATSTAESPSPEPVVQSSGFPSPGAPIASLEPVMLTPPTTKKIPAMSTP
ncbi:hypothetical protein E2C01_037066 [Portunus trituberculatus]|uniref:Uncharacterized protein n=1 Tax=Portunus trituberculatus TaxID=210409 RepID=A0A5B7FDS5_PORTR|nr:hypothetical protein [Portunus trituberculatus]